MTASGIAGAVSVGAQQSTTPALRYVDAAQATSDALVIDTRPLSACEKNTIAGAHCLPASDLLGPDGRLPSFADIFWALGTVGLSGHETVLIVGNQPGNRDFVAGLLYLCGQHRVEILTPPVEAVLREGHWPAGQGQSRGILRTVVYTASMRDKLIVLPAELARALAEHRPVVPIDGRSLRVRTPGPDAQTYTDTATLSGPRGQTVTDHDRAHVVRVRDTADAMSGDSAGHIPGALHLPLARLYRTPTTPHRLLADYNAPQASSNAAVPHTSTPVYYVAYANIPMDSIALFTRLRAGEADQRIDIRVMPAGWRGWITGPDYPVSHRMMTHAGPSHSPYIKDNDNRNTIYTVGVVMVSIAAMLMVIAAFIKGGKKWT